MAQSGSLNRWGRAAVKGGVTLAEHTTMFGVRNDNVGEAKPRRVLHGDRGTVPPIFVGRNRSLPPRWATKNLMTYG